MTPRGIKPIRRDVFDEDAQRVFDETESIRELDVLEADRAADHAPAPRWQHLMWLKAGER